MISDLKNIGFYKCKDLLFEQGLVEVKAEFADNVDVPTSGLIGLGCKSL